ncbi:hypothetical protein AVEN_256-1 [Araneus ventricosus]|uniref:Uncharacterized protein n=1 Tax=Araneus ventricosus TaxID=182803 RepID=A0A4Y2LNB2_ARAVE|nr:hypothetical protein AVEN_256-1 [Araneus ventricosus]
MIPLCGVLSLVHTGNIHFIAYFTPNIVIPVNKDTKTANFGKNLSKAEFYTINRPLPEERFYKSPSGDSPQFPSKVQNGNIYGTAIISLSNDRIKFFTV